MKLAAASRRPLWIAPRLLWMITAALALSLPAMGHPSYNLVLDGQGNLYFLDIFQNSLMKITPRGKVSELVDLRGVAPEERLHGLALGPDGQLYISGYYVDKVWKSSLSGELSIFFPFPGMDPFGSEVLQSGFDDAGAFYVLEWPYWPPEGVARGYRILKMSDPHQPPSVRYEGDAAFLDLHRGSMLVRGDGTLHLAGANRIWTVGSKGGALLVAGASDSGYVDARREKARFDKPFGMTLDRDGNIVVAETAGRIRRIDSDGVVSTMAGGAERGYLDGEAREARFESVFAVAADEAGRIYTVEFGGELGKYEYRVRILFKGRVRTLARIPSERVFRK